jgi:uncharacterized protein involved in type VI secretion and phage assembly
MIGLEDIDNSPLADARGGRIYGVVVGVVTNNKDPEKLGRIKVKFPWLSDADESNWARVSSPMAGPLRGIFFLPEIDDEVLVVFEHGLVHRPYVLGALWNKTDKPPEGNADGKNNLRIIKSRSGHTITLDDTDGKEKITVLDKTGKNKIEIDSSKNTITVLSDKDMAIQAGGNLSLASSGGNITIDCIKLAVAAENIELKASQQGKIEATAGLAITCNAGVNVNSGALEVK